MTQCAVGSTAKVELNLNGKQPMRVLHVDDEPSLLKIAKQCLEMQGQFQVDTASSVEEAFEKLKKGSYDIVVSDYQMPDRDGLEFLKELREKGDSIPFIMFTGRGREEVAVRALNLGADQYLDKNGDPETVYCELGHAIRTTVERQQVENSLKENEERLRAIVMNAPIGIATSGVDKLFLSANDTFCRILGYTEDELRKLTFKDITHPDDIKESLTNMEDLVAGRIPFFSQEKRYVKKDGNIINGRIMVSALRDQNSKPRIFIAELEDITERKEKDKALEESEERLKGIIDSSSDFIFLLDRDSKFLSINKVGADVRGKSPQELIGTSAFEEFPEATAAQFSENIKNVFDTGKGMFTEEKLLVDGRELYNSTSLNPVRDDRGRVMAVAGIVRDITERKKIEEELRRARVRFEALFMKNPEASVYLNDSFHILDINSRFSSLFGYSLDEVKDKKLNEIVVPPNLVEEGNTLDMKAGEGYVYHDTVRMKKDGSLIPVSVSAAPISIQGCLVGFIGVYKDISAQKSAERKLAMMNEKLRVIGGLTRHDVRNKLSIITANAYLIKKRLQDRPEVAEGFRDMESACGMILRIFDFARDYERLGVEELTYVDVEDCAQKAVSLFSNVNGIAIDIECHGVTVFADSLLRQLFYNLVDNSLKYGEHVTQIKIRYEKSAEQLKLIYEDNGVGISARAKSSIFNEGYTTGKGSGYGLYFIKKMMEVYEWTINESGTPGKGVQFVMTIPRNNNQGKENYRIAE